MPPKEHKRGIKRKRGDATKKEIDGRAKLSGKLHSGLVVLQRAAKKAKVFETQKIVKRLKKHDSSQKETENELEAQLKALKLLDTDFIIKSAFVTRLKKDGVLSKDEGFLDAVDKLNDTSGSTAAVPSTSDSPSAKLEARIRSSKHVAEVMKDCVESLRSLVLGKGGGKKGASKDSEGATDGEDEVGEEQGDEGDDNEAVPEESDSEFPTDENITTDFTTNRSMGADDEKEEDDGFGDAGWESGSIDEADSVGGDGEDDDENGWESGSVHSSASDTKPKKKVKLKSKSSSDRPQKPPVQPAESIFLPSLAVGYIRGSSPDDQWSDDGSVTKERKNRRGQRARRQIWEKKYGKGANHVKKLREAENAAMAAKMKARAAARAGSGSRGARPIGGFRGKPDSRFHSAPSGSGSSGPARPRHFGGPSGYSNPSGSKAPEPKAVVNSSLHPSWTAKKKAKEKEQLTGVGRGTKIKFD